MTELPDVFPITQVSEDQDGNPVVKRVRPLTYALMTFVKVNMEMLDTIDISEDETRASWNIMAPADPESDEENNLEVYIETYEEREFITIDIYLGSYKLSKKQIANISLHILETNRRLISGNFQIIDQSTIRYHSSIDFEGVASPDPNYEGPHLIQPKLIENMLKFGLAASRRVYKELPDGLGG